MTKKLKLISILQYCKFYLTKIGNLYLFRECGNDKGFAAAFGLGELVEDFIVETDVEGQIEQALEMINTTYTDVVNDFDFTEYQKTLNNFKIPDMSDISGQVQDVSGTLDQLSDKLDKVGDFFTSSTKVAEFSSDLENLKTSINTIDGDVTVVVNNVNSLDLQPVKTSISSLEANLRSPTSTVKNDVYAESSFIKANTLAFIDQFSDSLINKFGSCQVTYFTRTFIDTDSGNLSNLR